LLRGIDPLLGPDLLHVLASMGHGDELVIADANFPASSLGPKCIRADGATASDVLRAVLSLLPLDDFSDASVLTMQVVGNPDAMPDAVRDFHSIVESNAGIPLAAVALERFAFYKRAKSAFAVVQTGERRLYGNVILIKGVID
jgi:L-fucose mutarotase